MDVALVAKPQTPTSILAAHFLFPPVARPHSLASALCRRRPPTSLQSHRCPTPRTKPRTAARCLLRYSLPSHPSLLLSLAAVALVVHAVVRVIMQLLRDNAIRQQFSGLELAVISSETGFCKDTDHSKEEIHGNMPLFKGKIVHTKDQHLEFLTSEMSFLTPDAIFQSAENIEEGEKALSVSDVPFMLVEPICGMSAVPLRSEQTEISQDTKLDIVPGTVDKLLIETTDELVEKFDNKVSVCFDKKPDMVPTLCFKSLSAEPLHHLHAQYFSGPLQWNAGSFSDIRSTGSRSSVPGVRGPIAYHMESSPSEEIISKKVHRSTIGINQIQTYKVGKPRLSGKTKSGLRLAANDPELFLRTYNSLLTEGRLKESVDLLESMERKGILDMDKVHHTSFLKACKSKKAVKEAFRFCKLIKNPTMSTFNLLLSVCATSQDFEGAFQVMLLIKDAGLKPDCKLYTTLISTCGKSGKVDAMFEVFHEMLNAGVEPNVNTYGALIDGCARAGQVAKAFGAYGIMRSKKVQPDRVVFNALITACGESGAVDRAFDVLAEMKVEPKPIDPDHITVGALMKTCLQAGQVDRSWEVYKMLQEYKIKGTPEVYTIAVRGCSQTGDLDVALRIYDDMKRNGVRPDEMFLSTIVDVAGHSGQVDAGFKILQEAKANGIAVGSVSYSSLMGACCNAKNWKKALELYEEIKAIKLIPTVSMLNALVTSLCEGAQLLKAVQVLDEMKKLGVQPNIITYSVLIVACEKSGEAELGFTLFSEAKSDGILPNLIMSRCLTGLCLESFKKASSLGEPVAIYKSSRWQIDNKWTSLALMTYRETIQAGVIPTAEVFSQVLGCLQFPHDSSSRTLFRENIESNFDVSRRKNIAPLLDGFGEYDIRSFSILEEAASLGVVPKVSFNESPIVVDARKLLIHIVEVYLLVILKGLKHRLAAGAKLPNITVLLPTERTEIEFEKGAQTVNLAGRVGQAVGSLLRRLGLSYQGDESQGKIRISGLALRRWFNPNVANSSSARSGMISTASRLGRGIMDQQRSIRTKNL